MISFVLDIGDMRDALTNIINAHVRTWAGAAFVALAMLSIQYEEVIAPGMSRISHAWTATTAKLTSFSL
jgi:hypothetical protein